MYKENIILNQSQMCEYFFKKIMQINDPGNRIHHTKYTSIIWKENLNKKYEILI